MPIHLPSLRHGLLLALALLGLALAGAARAQALPERAVAAVELAPPAAEPLVASSAAPAAPARREIEIGSATEALWALQRASRGTYPRSIDGEQASRSYQRYLKSFETAIPERYGTGLELKK